ncbi:MAG: hypothetical protein K8F25_01590 [Fimbriimonadaceae bacterium]|nr:hypothetical protein [Alphaproteobacteria bacterium]
MADNVFHRDTQWDSKQDKSENKCPTDSNGGTDQWDSQNLIDARVEFEERAAIREYDGGYSREEAERMAIQDIERKELANLEKRLQC